MEQVLALGGFSSTCSCLIFPLGCLAGLVTSMRVGPPFSPLSSSPFVSRASCRCGYLCKVISVAVFPHVVCVTPVSTPWRALSTFCPWASLSPFLLSFRWVRCVRSALVDSHSCLVVPWPLSAPLSPSLASPCLHCGSWPLPGWLVRCSLLRVPCSPSFSSVFLYGFLWPSRSPAGPSLPFSYAIWVLCPVESSPSACVSPLWLFLFSHRVTVLWFLLSLQALVSHSTFTCMSRVCSLSCPSTFLG